MRRSKPVHALSNFLSRTRNLCELCLFPCPRCASKLLRVRRVNDGCARKDLQTSLQRNLELAQQQGRNALEIFHIRAWFEHPREGRHVRRRQTTKCGGVANP